MTTPKYEVCIVEDNGFDYDYIVQGDPYESKEDAFRYSNELKEKGFEYVCVREIKEKP